MQLACGVSIAAVAMANGVNANLARRWVVGAQRRSAGYDRKRRRADGLRAAGLAACGADTPATADIRIELRRGATAIHLS